MTENKDVCDSGRTLMSDELDLSKYDGHTKGPWYVGGTVGQHLRHGSDTCHLCGDHPLLRVGQEETSNPKDFSNTYHLHLILQEEDGPGLDVVSANGTQIVGMYDWEAGGVCTNRADANLIADAPRILAELKSTRQELARLRPDTQEGK